MVYFKFFILGISFVFVLMLTGCSNKETLGDIASNMLTYSQHTSSTNIEKEQDKELDSQNNKKRGVFSWISSGEKSKASQDESTIPSKIIDHSTTEEESHDIEAIKVVETTPGVEAEAKSFNVFKHLWAKINLFKYTNEFGLLDIPYKEDTISNRQGLNIVVLKVPQSDLSDKKIIECNGTLSVDFENNTISKDNLGKQQIYKDYFFNIQYKDNSYNKYNDFNYDTFLSTLHQDLINQLLSSNTITPNIIYIFYRDCSNKKVACFVNKQLYLTNYLYKIRAFIYSKNKKNTFVQEVKIDDLPINQVLLVLKPITEEQFSMLPKQTNLYNSTKTSIKDWLDKVNAMDNKTK